MIDIYIPPKTIKLLGSLGLSESSIYDVFHNGQQQSGQENISSLGLEKEREDKF